MMGIQGERVEFVGKLRFVNHPHLAPPGMAWAPRGDMPPFSDVEREAPSPLILVSKVAVGFLCDVDGRGGRYTGTYLHDGAVVDCGRWATLRDRDGGAARMPSYHVEFSDGRCLAGEFSRAWAGRRCVEWVREGR